MMLFLLFWFINRIGIIKECDKIVDVEEKIGNPIPLNRNKEIIQGNTISNNNNFVNNVNNHNNRNSYNMRHQSFNNKNGYG